MGLEQFRRAPCHSVAANIVEGFAHRPGRSRLHFLHISQSSLAEAGYCVHAATRLGYIDKARASQLEVEIKRVGAPLSGLVRTTQRNLPHVTHPTYLTDPPYSTFDVSSRPRVSGPSASSTMTTRPDTAVHQVIAEASGIPLSSSMPMIVGVTAASPPPA